MRVIVHSGGQSGVDVSSLRAAKSLGLTTGGWMPKGWLTEDGPRPEYAELYGMFECPEPSDESGFKDHAEFYKECYRARTLANARDSLMTLWYGPIGSRGYKLTLGACNKLNKKLVYADYYGIEESIGWIEQESKGRKGIVLNCAGNRESTQPGIGEWAEAFMIELFSELMKG